MDTIDVILMAALGLGILYLLSSRFRARVDKFFGKKELLRIEELHNLLPKIEKFTVEKAQKARAGMDINLLFTSSDVSLVFHGISANRAVQIVHITVKGRRGLMLTMNDGRLLIIEEEDGSETHSPRLTHSEIDGLYNFNLKLNELLARFGYD